MQLSEISTWVANAKSYWHSQLNAECNAYDLAVHSVCASYSNIVTLKSQIDSSLNEFQTVYNSYMSDDTRVTSLKNTLMPLYTYAVLKNMVTDPPYSVPSAITDEDVRNWFRYYTYDIPDTAYTTFFTISDVYNSGCSNPTYSDQASCELNGGTWTNIPTTLGQVTVNASRNNLLNIFNGFIQDDKDNIDAFSGVSPAVINDRLIFNLYSEPKIVIDYDNFISTRQRVLNHMHLWEVMQLFGWSIDGVTWDNSWTQV